MFMVHACLCIPSPNNFRNNRQIFRKVGMNTMPLEATPPLYFQIRTVNINMKAVQTCEVGVTLEPLPLY